MAQYYRVLSQDDKATEEVTQFYPGVDENQTVQYVIASDGNQQQFQAQPVVVSSDQLMVVEGQGQPVIIDQSQVAYNQSQYVIQDASGIEFQNNSQQQVYYMTNTAQNQSVIVEQQLTQQPVVLNHQIMQSHMTKVNVTTPVQNIPSNALNTSAVMQDKNSALQQIKNQLKAHALRQGNVAARGIPLNAQRIISQGIQNFPQNTAINEKDNDEREEETVAMSDGRLITMSQYSKLLVQQKQNQAQQERVVLKVAA